MSQIPGEPGSIYRVQLLPDAKKITRLDSTRAGEEELQAIGSVQAARFRRVQRHAPSNPRPMTANVDGSGIGTIVIFP
jgi:hypothetical protein